MRAAMSSNSRSVLLTSPVRVMRTIETPVRLVLSTFSTRSFSAILASSFRVIACSTSSARARPSYGCHCNADRDLRILALRHANVAKQTA